MDAEEYFPNLVITLIGTKGGNTPISGLESILGFKREKEINEALNILEDKGIIQTDVRKTSNLKDVEYAALTEEGTKQYELLMKERKTHRIFEILYNMVRSCPDSPIETICKYLKERETEL